MPSNSLLLPTKSMVAWGNQWEPRINSDGYFKILDYQPTIMGITAQNMPETSNSNCPLLPTKSVVAMGNQC